MSTYETVMIILSSLSFIVTILSIIVELLLIVINKSLDAKK